MGPPKPIPVEDFLKGGHLRRGDILLASEMGSLTSFLIRLAIRSHFSHAALVFLTPNRLLGFEQTYLIESSRGGVDITALSEYVARPDRPHLVAIKRFEAPWFDPRLGSLVSGRMLRFIKEDYDYLKATALGTQVSRWVFRMRNLIFGRPPSVRRYVRYISRRMEKKRYVPAEFICSGFVQYAFVDVVIKIWEEFRQARRQREASSDLSAIEREDEAILNRLLEDVLFADWLEPDSSMESLLAVTPLDLAKTPKLSWKYIIFDGLAYEVRSPQEAETLLATLMRDA